MVLAIRAGKKRDGDVVIGLVTTCGRMKQIIEIAKF